MQIPDDLLCLFTADVTERDDSYIIEVPIRELDHGGLQSDSPYRIAVLQAADASVDNTRPSETTSEDPPVAEGETREFEIEDVGDQGDGIARIDGGYVVIVEDARPGERVTAQVTEVRKNVAFAEVVDSPLKPA